MLTRPQILEKEINITLIIQQLAEKSSFYPLLLAW